MSLNTKQFRYGADNLGYLVYDNKSAMAIDGGAPGPMLQFLESEGMSLKYVTNTHDHMDHMGGNDILLKKSKAEFIDHRALIKSKSLSIDGNEIKVLHTPGHTKYSIVFYFNNTLITGDTLFIAKVGRCFTGDLREFYESIQVILDLPDETVFYPGHDYVEEYISWLKNIDPHNPHIEKILKKYSPRSVFSTLGDEKMINPFLRLTDEGLVSILRDKGLPAASEYERWESVMSII